MMVYVNDGKSGDCKIVAGKKAARNAPFIEIDALSYLDGCRIDSRKVPEGETASPLSKCDSVPMVSHLLRAEVFAAIVLSFICT